MTPDACTALLDSKVQTFRALHCCLPKLVYAGQYHIAQFKKLPRDSGLFTWDGGVGDDMHIMGMRIIPVLYYDYLEVAHGSYR